MAKWIAWDESGCRETIEADSAEDAAREYVDSGDWPDDGVTVHHEVLVVPACDEDDAYPERITVSVDPTEPACPGRDAHDWRDDAEPVFGSDHGGVRCFEHCRHCGLRMVTDTGATNVSNGERCTTVRYPPADDRNDSDEDYRTR